MPPVRIANPVIAFANFRRILRPAGRLAFSCWRSQDNELDYFPVSAVGVQSAVDETPFSFANPEYVCHILTVAEFKEINIQVAR